MDIAPLLNIRPGVTAIIGGGGKTTLLYTLGEELSKVGRVILTTTTHIFVPTHCPVLTEASVEGIQQALTRTPLLFLCVGTPSKEGKLSSPLFPIEALSTLADYVLVEADGSKGLPLKAHAPYEPVIPGCASNTILVVGIDGLGQPVEKVCHRSNLYATLAEVSESGIVTSEIGARVIMKEGFGDRVYINKVETESHWQSAQALAELLSCPVVAGSLHRREYRCLR